MADKSKSKTSKVSTRVGKTRRVVKAPETVRQKREKANGEKPKQRRVHQTAAKASTPFKAVWRGVKKVLRPFRFVLRPFKTRPARFVGRILSKLFLVNYIKNSWKELRLVQWPNRRDTAKLTVAVFVFATALSLLIASLDFVLDKVFKQILT